MNPQEIKQYDIVVIGAGAGGLVVAIGAVKAGKKVLLIEKGRYGGDCTNFGCIPSKTLIASAESAHHLQTGKTLGLEFECQKFKATKALERVQRIVTEVRFHEEPDALKDLRVETLTGCARFKDSHHLLVTNQKGEEMQIHGTFIVLATGSYPFIPPFQGLSETPYLTNETIFDLKEIPKSLAVLGAGPIGCELAQAFSRLGSKVTIIESERGILPNEDPEVQKVMKDALERENVQIFTRCDTNLISFLDETFSICVSQNGSHIDTQAEALLVSTGRRPNVSDLHLDNAGVAHSEKGIPIDSYCRTNQSHIFAIGDVVGGPLFTHVAENQGRNVLTTLLLPGPLKKKRDLAQAIPRCTFTDPEVASIGLLEKEAINKFGEKKIAIYRVPLEGVDRAITAERREGFVKVVTKKWSSKILGATIVAPRAGEMLPELSLAMLYKIPLRRLARLIHPYPIYNAAIRKAADLWLTQTILPSIQKLFKRKNHG